MEAVQEGTNTLRPSDPVKRVSRIVEDGIVVPILKKWLVAAEKGEDLEG